MKAIDVFSPLDHVYNLTVGSHSYPIRYSIPLGKGTVESIKANTTSKSITIIIDGIADNSSKTTTTADSSFFGLNGKSRLFSFELPRNIIDSNNNNDTITTGKDADSIKGGGGCSSFIRTDNGAVLFWSNNQDKLYKISVNTISDGKKIATYYNNTLYSEQDCGTNNNNEILSIGYPTGSKSAIIIQETANVVPEFSSSSLASLVMVSGLVGVMVIVLLVKAVVGEEGIHIRLSVKVNEVVMLAATKINEELKSKSIHYMDKG